MLIIPIGLQCTGAIFKRNINKKSFTYPFDWMFATPKFVYEMLELLLVNNMNITELVKQHFFYCDRKASLNGLENYILDDRGFALYNTKYNVIFPHDVNKQENIEKYIRRFERLKDTILKSSEDICFVYVSQSSSTIGNFTINGIDMCIDIYIYLSKIYELIGKYKNCKMIVFDTIKKEDKSLLNENIKLLELDECNSWNKLLVQMDKYKDLF